VSPPAKPGDYLTYLRAAPTSSLAAVGTEYNIFRQDGFSATNNVAMSIAFSTQSIVAPTRSQRLEGYLEKS